MVFVTVLTFVYSLMQCSENNQCITTCLDNVCSPFATLGDFCEESEDCLGDIFCSTTENICGGEGAACKSDDECLLSCLSSGECGATPDVEVENDSGTNQALQQDLNSLSGILDGNCVLSLFTFAAYFNP